MTYQEPESTPYNPALARLAQSSHALLLQGPVGPFFDRLTYWMQANGTKVERVALQGGDLHDCQAVIPRCYDGTLEDWPQWFSALLVQLATDCIVLFGQSRKYHSASIRIAEERGISVIVFEEGCFRPGFATMELSGVNGYSTTLQRYRWDPSTADAAAALLPTGPIQPDISPHHFRKMAWHASQHYAAMWRAQAAFPHYQHHRISDPFHHAAYWLRSWSRKLRRKGVDLRTQAQLFSGSTPYYFVPLQHDGDAQIVYHSPYAENTDFVIEVLRSFAWSAPAGTLLVFKQHPHARGGPGHVKLIRSLAAELGVGPRVLHLVEGDTPDLAQHSAGVVLINSTVGLQALERGAPLMVLGDAIYNRPGLTYQGLLDTFWHEAHPPDYAQCETFIAQMKNLTQVPASVYALRSEPLCWLPRLQTARQVDMAQVESQQPTSPHGGIVT